MRITLIRWSKSGSAGEVHYQKLILWQSRAVSKILEGEPPQLIRTDTHHIEAANNQTGQISPVYVSWRKLPLLHGWLLKAIKSGCVK